MTFLGRPAIEAAFAEMPDTAMQLRALIFEVASTLDDVESVEEVLRWGQPSYISPIGSTLRIGKTKSGQMALFAHCQSDIIARHAHLFANKDQVQGNRAVLAYDLAEIGAFRALITYALRYHKAKKS